MSWAVDSVRGGAVGGGTAGAVAIVGVACRFAGAPDADGFWANLLAGRDCLTRQADPRVADLGGGVSRVWSWGLAPARDRFDNALVGVPAGSDLDPQHGILYESLWLAVE